MADGLCQCGCGGKTKIAPRSYTLRGWVKGEPQPYLRGHAAWKYYGPKWIEGPIPEHRPDLGPCWIWQRALSTTGYALGGFKRLGYSGPKLVHRVLYEQHIGPIPYGLELDHLCRVPACVRPTHMEPVTGRENILRSPATKLQDEDLPEIYKMRLAGQSWRSIANEYGMTHPPIIYRMQAWCARTGMPYA